LPVTVSSGANPAIDIAAGHEHACAVLSDNSVTCWGASTANATALTFRGVSGDELSAGVIVYDGKI
jgi:hypothetical protein